MYLFVSGIYFASFYDFSIMKCSDSVVLLSSFYHYTRRLSNFIIILSLFTVARTGYSLAMTCKRSMLFTGYSNSLCQISSLRVAVPTHME
jgi:hypothetical protein